MKKAELRAGQDARPVEHPAPSLSTGSPLAPESFDVRLRGRQGGRAPRLHLGRHRHLRLLRARHPDQAGLARRDPGPGARASPSTSSTTSGKPHGARQGRARLHEAVPVHADRLLERSRRQEVPRRLFRALSQHLAPRRLRRVDRARRHDHPRPLRRHAQSRRRAHRHGRDLPPGRAAAGGAGEHRHRPGLGRRRARGAVRAC